MRSLQRGSARGHPSQEKSLQRGSARGHPSQETSPSNKSARTIRKFNPGTLQTDAEVIEQFVVRHREFGILRDVLERNARSSTCQHLLVVGPRGRGKTMLLARAAAELRTSETLRRRFLPVRFTEESYEVFDIGDFWLDALFHLAPEAARLDAEMADELRAAHAEFSGRWRGRDLEERARGVVLDAASRLGRKLVLMVENCQSLFEDVDERFGWSLRKTLQTEPDIVFLGSATSRMAALSDVDGPFYEFFRQLALAPLPLEECKALWEMVSGAVRSEREIRPLQILTGGDPRLLAIISSFANHRSLKELLQELVSLIDDHTEYFRSHLEGLGKTERRVYLALVDLWRPSTTAEIAARSRQDIRAVSSLLGRLVKRGAIAYQGSSKKRLYEPTQRLYSIYYKLRRQRDEAAVVGSLIQWMVAFFTGDDLSTITGMLVDEAMQSSVVLSGHAASCMALCDKAVTLARMNRAEEAIAAWEGAAAHIGAELPASVRECLAVGLYCKAELQVQLHRPDEALATIDQLAAGFTPSTVGTTLPRAEWTRARALLVKGERRLALDALRQAYDGLSFDGERTARHLLHHVPQLIGCGFAERDLIEVLSSDPEKRTLAEPIIAVLRQRIGEEVRIPAEVRECAMDMAEHVDQAIAKVRRLAATKVVASDSPSCEAARH